MSEADARAGRGGVSYDTFDTLAKHHGINYEIKYTLNYVPVWVEDNSTDGSPGEVCFAILIPLICTLHEVKYSDLLTVAFFAPPHVC